jgi:hypothetical protein
MFALASDTKDLFGDPVVRAAFLGACIASGLLMCLFGHRLFRLTLGLAGALVGGFAAAAGGSVLSNGNETATIVTGVLGTILGAVLMVTTHLLAVFAIGAGLGALVAWAVPIEVTQPVKALVIAGSGVIGGLLALLLKKPLVIVATALNGAALSVLGTWLLLTRRPPLELVTGKAERPAQMTVILLIAVWTVIGSAGAYIQFSSGRTRGEPANDPASGAEDASANDSRRRL